jgi:hypothetical protein
MSTVYRLLICLVLVLLTNASMAEQPYDHAARMVQIYKNPSLAPLSAFQKGIVYASWWPGEYASAESDQTLAQAIKPLGVNWIAIVVTCYQDSITSTRIKCKPESLTPTDADLTHIIRDAHRIGLRVMLKPHIDLSDKSKHWRGEISFGKDENAWREWFSNYNSFITHYAKLAQEANADYFVVGTELVQTSYRTAQWRDIIKAVRNLYTGPLTYSAHHFDEEFSINWWDALDTIGIDAYYPLAHNSHPTVAQIKKAWIPIVARLGKLSKKWDRPVILTEVGYESLEGTNRTPWQSQGHKIEFEEQADSYQALFDAFANQDWWRGVFWWVWTIHTARNSPINSDFTTYNKPADDVLMSNFGVAAHATPPPLPPLDDDDDNQLKIFHNTLTGGWRENSHNIKLSVDISETMQFKNTELRVLMQPAGILSLYHNGADTSPYRWLEFYIYTGKTAPHRFLVNLFDGSNRESGQPISLPHPRYVEGGRFLADQWQRVRIPLADMGAENLTITRLNLKNALKKQPVEFFITEISLVGPIELQAKLPETPRPLTR